MNNLARKLSLISTFALISTVAACGGDKPAATTVAADAAPESAEEFRARQARFADSVLNAVKSPKELAAKLGKGYDVGSIRLRDTLALLSEKSNCYFQGRQTDPYLAGSVSWFVFMSVIGSNVIRVQDSQWTSVAGNIVNSCLNQAAKKWTFEPSFGKQGSYITQVQMKPEYVKPEKAAVKK